MAEQERKARSFEKLPPQQKRIREELNPNDDQLTNSGLLNSTFTEPVPQVNIGSTARIFQNSHNASLIAMTDQPSGPASGYGGKGHTGAGAIYLVAGRQSSIEGGPDGNAIVTNNMFSDAAGIYISQKTDIDTNYALVGNTQSVARSGVGIKGDAVRIIGREGIKFVTGKGKNLQGTGAGGEKNSQGGNIETVAGIELIAGNDLSAEKLEPLVKAYALSDTLMELVQMISDLADIVNENAKVQTQINNSLIGHTHIAPPAGPTSPPVVAGITIAAKEVQKLNNVHLNLYKNKMNLGTSFVETRLNPTGKKWFGSRFNKTN